MLLPVESLPTTLSSLLPDLSIGGVLGLSAGYAIKKVGRAVMFVVGALFVLIQLLAYAGFVSVNWGQVQTAAEPLLRDGARHSSAWLWRALAAHLPFGAAFAAGLALGLRAR